MTLVVAVALAVGTVWGDDDDFPLAPVRLFSSTPSASSVDVVRLEALTNDRVWRRASLSPPNVGLSGVEVERQLERFRRRPALLGALAGAHSRLRGDDEPWICLRLVREQHRIAPRGARAPAERLVVAEWTLEQEWVRE